MQVCLVQMTDFPQAGRVDIYEYARALAGFGVKTDVIVCRRLSPAALPKQLTVHQLNLPTTSNLSNTFRFVYRAFSVIGKFKAQDPILIVHLFNPAPATFLLGLALRLSPRRPRIIYDVRTGGLGRSLDALAINAMARWSRLFADGVIVLTKALARRLYRQPPKRFAVVTLGVNLKTFVPIKRSQRAILRYLYIGTLNKNRRLKNMIEAFSWVYAKNHAVRLSIAGEGNDRARLERLTKRRRLAHVVSFLGAVPFANIPRLLARVDCGLNYVPITAWFNPQPSLKTLEYLATNLPVVATATAGNRAVWDGLPRQLLTGDKPEQFADGMLYVSQNIKTLKQTDFRAKAIPFDWSRIVKKNLIPFYRQIIKS